jgi:NCS2 family nucleobase:cation symporter-2/xanthine permease XanP
VPERRFFALEEKIDLPTSLLTGIQHVLAMFVGIITPPLIVAGAMGLELADTAFLISMALFTSGVATFIQVRRFGPVGSGMLSVQGTSFVFVSLGITAGAAGGLPLIFGMTLAAAPVEMALSRVIGVARRLFPPVVTGSVVMLIGVTLIQVGMTDLAGGFGAEDFGSPRNLALGFFTMAAIIVFNRFGRGLVSTVSIALGLVLGYAAAAVIGMVDFSRLGEAGWVSAPRPLRFGLDFEWALLVPWMIAYFVTTLESMGDLTATSGVSREPVEGPIFIGRLKGGVLADGIGSVIAGLFCAMPNTTFSQNNGVIGLTGVASRRAGLAVAGILVLLGLVPKIAALISVMPPPVLGGATTVMFAMVAVAGLRIIVSGGLSVRTEFILAITLALGLGVKLVPNVFDQVPIEAVRIILTSPIAVGAITATALNLILPRDDR